MSNQAEQFEPRFAVDKTYRIAHGRRSRIVTVTIADRQNKNFWMEVSYAQHKLFLELLNGHSHLLPAEGTGCVNEGTRMEVNS